MIERMRLWKDDDALEIPDRRMRCSKEEAAHRDRSSHLENVVSEYTIGSLNEERENVGDWEDGQEEQGSLIFIRGNVTGLY